MARPPLRSSAALLATCVATVLACRENQPATDASAKPRNVRITIERTPCFGRCPIYSLEMDSAGRVSYEGKGFVKTMGRQDATIPANEVQALARELEDAGYFGFRDSYPADATDHAIVITTLTIDGKTKRVEHDLSSLSAPKPLAALERRIDEVARSSHWVGVEPSTAAPAAKRAPGDTSPPRG